MKDRAEYVLKKKECNEQHCVYVKLSIETITIDYYFNLSLT